MGCDFTIHIGKPPIKRQGLNTDLDCRKAIEQPHISIGECSFLKAMLFNDPKAFIPEPIRRLAEIIPSYGEEPITINDELIEKIKKIEWRNNTVYNLYTTKEKLIKFLEKHRGKPCYHICW